MRLRLLRLAFPVALVLLLAAPLCAQARYNIHFRSSRAAGDAGEVVALGIGLDNQPEAVTGFQFGVKHVDGKLTIDSVDIGPGLQSVLGAGKTPDPRFYSLNVAPAGGTGFTVGLILSADDANVVLSSGLDHHIFDVKYRIPDGATGDTKVDITGDLGSPRVAVILDRNGTAQAPAGAAALTSATVAVSTGPAPFVRGDADQSGHLDITDATLILDYLFTGATLPAGNATRTGCLIAMNFDGSVGKGAPDVEDAQDIDITDAPALLQFLFQRGLPPQPPFPACGQPAGTASADMVCQDFLCR